MNSANSTSVIGNLEKITPFTPGLIPDDLFSTTAAEIVNELKKDNGITITQIRRFYNDLLSVKSKVELQSSSSERIAAFKLQIPYVNMMIARARYAKNRGNVGDNFVRYIEQCVKPLNSNNPGGSYDHFKVFCSLFEAVVAYAKGVIRDR